MQVFVSLVMTIRTFCFIPTKTRSRTFKIVFFPSFRRRTHAVFDVALKVHRNIQERDIEVGRNLGNWILRWLDQMKPSAQIGGSSPGKPPSSASSGLSMTKQISNSSNLKPPWETQIPRNQDSSRHLFTSPRSIWPKPFPTISMMMRPPKPAGTMTQYRHFSGPEMLKSKSNSTRAWSVGGLRKDIMQWML
jgi:hypothetical protein